MIRSGASASDTLYDVVIRNGRVLDGEGNPWILADVAIKDGRFVKIGRIAAHGKREIDARGKYVSPGWIDMMDQSGSVLRRNGLAENKLQEGVTTAIGGEGGTPVPAGQVAEFFNTLERQGISINFGSATYEKPMGFPAGIEWVLVNGVVAIDHGKHTGAKAGRALRGPGTDKA